MFQRKGTSAPLWILLLCCSAKVNGESLTVTGDQTKVIVCGAQKIVIEKVYYGGSDPGICVRLSAFDVVVINCFKKASCELNNTLFNTPDPCPGVNKKLEVTYSCAQDNQILDICQADDIKLEIGKPLFVVSPNYPNIYPPGVCELTVNPPDLKYRADLKVEILFMQMEIVPYNTSCYDKLVLQEPGNAAKTFEYCGITPEHSGNPVTLTMEKANLATFTGQTTNQKGFVAKITDTAWSKPCPLPHNCQNDAKCLQSDSGTNNYCLCITDHTGETCTEVWNSHPCVYFPCQNGGLCVRLTNTTFKCNCPVGFSGEICQIPNSQVSNCFPTCINGGRCVRIGFKYVCECNQAWGFSGKYCQTPCGTVNPCKNGGVCKVINGHPSCICAGNYKGKECQTLPKCFPCKNYGLCVFNSLGPVCRCTFGFYGPRCEKAVFVLSGSDIPVASMTVTFVVFLIINHVP